jgi:hypothetical protein
MRQEGRACPQFLLRVARQTLDVRRLVVFA